MMKRLFILFTIFLSYASTTLQAQDNLPQNFSISLGGGVTLPRVEGNRNDFSVKWRPCGIQPDDRRALLLHAQLCPRASV